MVAFWTTCACERQVELIPTEPETVHYCQVDDRLLGAWVSDSVEVTTRTDSNDSVASDPNPTLLYQMRINCGEDTLFRLFYDNFAGARTEDVRSTNFQSSVNGIYVFNALDASNDTATAEYVLRVVLVDSSRLNAWFVEMPNSQQTTRTEIFFRKD